MQRFIFTGRLTRDPEISYSKDGTAITKYTVAVDRRYKPEGAPTADFFNCTVFGKQAENDDKYLHQGDLVGITATIALGKWKDKDGKNHPTIDIYPQEVDYLQTKR